MIRQLLALLLLLCLATGTAAQTSQEKVFFDLDTGFSLANNSFTETWNPSPGAHFNARIPFYAGQIEAGIRYTRFNGDAPSEADSDFHSIFIHLGWNYPVDITPWYQVGPTLRFGNHFMLFDESAVFTNEPGTERFVTDQSESEFAYEFALRNQFRLSEDWHLNATVSYNRTLTFFPLSVTLVSVGVTYSFPQPNWLKQFIR